MDLEFFLSAKTSWENVVREGWLDCFSVLQEMERRWMGKTAIKMPFFLCSVFGKICSRKMRNCSISVRQALTIEVTGAAENWVRKPKNLCLSSSLKTGLTHLAVAMTDAFLNCSWKIFMAGESRLPMWGHFQRLSVHFAWLDISSSLGFLCCCPNPLLAVGPEDLYKGLWELEALRRL